MSKLVESRDAFERTILGLALAGNEDVVELAGQHGVSAETFSSEPHAAIWNIVLEDRRVGRTPDIIAVGELLRRRASSTHTHRWTFTYLVELLDQAPLAQNASYYLEQLSGIAWAIRTCQRLTEARTEIERSGDSDWSAVRARVSGVLGGLMQEGPQKPRKSPSKLADEMAEEIDNRIALSRSGMLRGVPTGFRVLDKILGGWVETRLHIVAARPGTGKTVFGAELVDASNRAGIPWLYATLEMDALAMKERRLVRAAGVVNTHVQSGRLGDDEIDRLGRANFEQAERDVGDIDDQCVRHLETFESVVRTEARRRGRRLFVLDYLQQMRVRSMRFPSRTAELEEITYRLKQLAITERVAIVAMAQLSRAAETSSRTMLSHLKDAGSIEQDADVVMFLERQEDDHRSETQIWLVIAKNRHGPTCKFPLAADLSVNKMEQANINEEAFEQ